MKKSQRGPNKQYNKAGHLKKQKKRKKKRKTKSREAERRRPQRTIMSDAEDDFMCDDEEEYDLVSDTALGNEIPC